MSLVSDVAHLSFSIRGDLMHCPNPGGNCHESANHTNWVRGRLFFAKSDSKENDCRHKSLGVSLVARYRVHSAVVHRKKRLHGVCNHVEDKAAAGKANITIRSNDCICLWWQLERSSFSVRWSVSCVAYWFTSMMVIKSKMMRAVANNWLRRVTLLLSNVTKVATVMRPKLRQASAIAVFILLAIQVVSG